MHATERDADEAFQPIPVRPASAAPLRFAMRCLVDLQLLTIQRFLKPHLVLFRGRVLDVGAGEMPWRELMPGVDYVGIDVEGADRFGMRRNGDLIYFDGRVIPFPDGAFDHVLCVEVLEHVEAPDAFMRELARVLRPDGSLALTMPWSARLHHLPQDYQRFTRHALHAHLARAGFRDIAIEERGNDVAVVANKLVVIVASLVRWRGAGSLWRLPLVVLTAPVAAAFVLAAHVSMATGSGSKDDPLGYGVTALRS